MNRKLAPDPVDHPHVGELVEDEVDWHDRLATLIEAKWLIAAVTIVALAIGWFYAFVQTPIYRSNALLQVQQQGNTSISSLSELSPLFTGETAAVTEIEIIRSRSIVRAAVDDLRLDIVAEPRYFPLIGAAIARRQNSSNKNNLAEPWWGLDQFAWGGERIRVQRLEVPPEYEGRGFTLTADENGTYRLHGTNTKVLLTGEVGKTAKGALDTSASKGNPANASVEIFVAELHARKGTQFRVAKRPRAQVVRALQGRLRVSEKGRYTGIIQVALEGTQPQRLAATLDAISQAYVRQNVERRSEEAGKMLQFLNAQLPVVKANLDAAETRLNAYRSKLGSIDLTLESQAMLEQLAQVEKQLSALELKRTELRRKFTENHPVIITLKQKMKQLGSERAALNRQIKTMPEETQESVRLMRDVKVANELYLLLLNKAQELNVVKAGTIGNVRIVDPALIPSGPVKPQKRSITTLSTGLGLVLGIMLAFLLKALRRGVEDPDRLEQELGLPIYATIPHSVKQEGLTKLHKKDESSSILLGLREPNDIAMESVRSLRTSLQFGLIDAKNNIVSLAGPSFGVGKSFVSANLAYASADAGKHTLLIDADMRKGHLHEYFLTKRRKGLSEVISGEIEVWKGIRTTEIDNLAFLPAGTVPPNPSELLMSDRFQTIIKTLSEQYDLVVIDTPPILAVTDATIIGHIAGINLILLRSGQHPMKEIEQAVKRLEQNGIKPHGFIFNQVPLRTGLYRRYGYHYRYEYK